MNIFDMLRAAANDRVYVMLSGNNLKVVGLGSHVKSWAPRLRHIKAQLLNEASLNRSGPANEHIYAVDLSGGLQEAFQERAAIMQFDGGLPQELAERLAAQYVLGPYSAIPIGVQAIGPTAANCPSSKKECP